MLNIAHQFFDGLMCLKELKMFLIYLLVICLILLLAFSISKEKGKNTRFARKDVNLIAKKSAKKDRHINQFICLK